LNSRKISNDYPFEITLLEFRYISYIIAKINPFRTNVLEQKTANYRGD